MRAYDVAFVGAFCFQFPVLMPVLQEHLADYDSLLPHVLMGDVTRWVVQRFLANAGDSTLRQMLDMFEMAFEKAKFEERELLAASFLENLPRAGEEGAGIRAILGPALQEQLLQIP
jgi:hypothetical protein